MTDNSIGADKSQITIRLREAGCVFAEDEARLLIAAATTPTQLATMVERRTQGVPLELVIGWAEFCGLRIALDDGVFVPRARSEFLVNQAAALAGPGSVVVDLCCGSGAIGMAVAAAVGPVKLYCVDIDGAAVNCARRNLVGEDWHVYQGDLYEALPDTLRGTVAVLIANAPYVPTGAVETLPREARLYEPLVALDGGVDGLDVQRRIAVQAPNWLEPGGHLLIETSQRQAERTAQIITSSGMSARVARSDDVDATVVIGVAPADGTEN